MNSRLAEFEITGLFGLYDHKIPLKTGERITIVIGPNGRGKTVCLRLVEALFQKRFDYFLEVPFVSAAFRFTEGEEIEVVREDQLEVTPDSRRLRLALNLSDSNVIHWNPTQLNLSLVRELRRYIPAQWQQSGYDRWIDQTDGETLTSAELVERYPVPPKFAARLREEIPPEIDRLLSKIDCHLIETQRLLVLPGAEASEEGFFGFSGQQIRRPRRVGSSSSLAIQDKAQRLTAIIKDTLTNYASLSQSLDRTFPLRVFEAQASVDLTQDDLRKALAELDERRKSLMATGILDSDYQHVTLKGGRIDPGVAKALEIYVSDGMKKLDVFSAISAKIDLFKQLIGSRFIDKNIQIDRQNGFKIFSKTGAEVPLDKLSSGEQHQLILVFGLLFEVRNDSLILIDEPELSLHVAWQKSFIDSLKKMIALNGFDVLLATHSPALVAKHVSLSVELGPVE